MAIIPQSFRSDSTKIFSGEARELGLKLSEIVNANLSDLVTMEKQAKLAGFAQDGVGQWFHVAKGADNGVQVPTPTALQPSVMKSAPVLI